MYRFCVRYFLFAMDAWKKVDGERLARDMEEPYSIAYRAVLWATNVVGQDESAGPDNETMLKQAQAQLDKMRFVLEKTMGKAAAKDKMEELEATQNLLMAEALSMEMEQVQSIEVDSGPQSPSKAEQMHWNEKASDKATAHPPSPSSTPYFSDDESSSDAMSKEEMRYLERLAKSAGMENERIAHELVLDPSYSLPALRADFTIPDAFEGRLERQLAAFMVAQQEAKETGVPPSPALMKLGISAMMGDTLQWSVRKSFLSADEGDAGLLKQLSVGMVLPINYSGKTMSARLLSIDEDDGSCATLTVKYETDGGQEGGVALTRIKTSATPPDPDVLLMTFKEMINAVASLTPTRTEIRASLEQSCDLELLHGMLANDACSASDLANPLAAIFDALQNLLEPTRATLMGKWREQIQNRWTNASLNDVAIMLPYIFETLGSVIEEVKREMANYFVELLAPVLGKNGKEFLRLKMENRMKDTLDSVAKEIIDRQATNGGEALPTPKPLAVLMAMLPKTAAIMLPDTHPDFSVDNSNLASLSFPCRSAEIVEIGLPLIPAEGDCARTRAAVLMVRLLQVPVRLDTPEASRGVVPEILQYDAGRLASIRDDLDVIALLATLMITLKQCMHTLKQKTPSNTFTFDDADLNELHSRLDALLRNHQVTMPDVTKEIVRFVRYCASRHGVSSSGLAAGWETTLEHALTSAVKKESPMISLFSKRLFKVLLRGLGKKPYSNVLTTFSLNSVNMQRAIQDVLTKAESVLALNLHVNAVIYKWIYGEGLA
jgi:hypothetical protein